MANILKQLQQLFCKHEWDNTDTECHSYCCQKCGLYYCMDEWWLQDFDTTLWQRIRIRLFFKLFVWGWHG